MTKPNSIAPCLGLSLILLSPAVMAQDSSNPRTEYGQPNLQGTYTFRTLTPLNRPPELADKATLTAEEVAEWEQFELRRQNRDLIIDSVGGAGYPPGSSLIITSGTSEAPTPSVTTAHRLSTIRRMADDLN